MGVAAVEFRSTVDQVDQSAGTVLLPEFAACALPFLLFRIWRISPVRIQAWESELRLDEAKKLLLTPTSRFKRYRSWSDMRTLPILN
jgi:hypothetical protein